MYSHDISLGVRSDGSVNRRLSRPVDVLVPIETLQSVPALSRSSSGYFDTAWSNGVISHFAPLPFPWPSFNACLFLSLTSSLRPLTLLPSCPLAPA